MAGKRRKKPKKESGGSTPRRGMRRSIRYDTIEDSPDEPKPSRGPAAPPTIHLRKISAEEALDRLSIQLRGYARQGISEVLVIHGKGLNSTQGVSILGPLARQWCDDNPAIVSNWREAPLHWGGSGAIVVILN